MRWWSPVALLPPVVSLFLPAAANAPPGIGIDHAVHDIQQDNSTKTLFSRDTARTASEIFMIDTGPGGCAGREAALDLWVQEAGQLHKALLTMQENASGDMVAGGLFFAWLGVTPLDIKNKSRLWQVITGHTARVQQFLTGGGLRDPQVENEKPRLFCGAEMGVHQPWNAVLKDNTGTIVEDEDWGALPIRAAYPKFIDTNCNAFWVEAFKGYDIDCGGEETLCPARDADTQKVRHAKTANRVEKFEVDEKAGDFTLGLGNRHILFCPPVFNPGNSHAVESLRTATSAANYPKAGEKDIDFSLDRYLTISATMYHELYHLTDGSGDADTSDLTYNMNDILSDHIVNNRIKNAQNPETYTFLAMACYMYLNAPEQATRAIYYGGWPHTITQFKERFPRG